MTGWGCAIVCRSRGTNWLAPTYSLPRCGTRRTQPNLPAVKGFLARRGAQGATSPGPLKSSSPVPPLSLLQFLAQEDDNPFAHRMDTGAGSQVGSAAQAAAHARDSKGNGERSQGMRWVAFATGHPVVAAQRAGLAGCAGSSGSALHSGVSWLLRRRHSSAWRAR